MGASIIRLRQACLIAYALLAAVATALHNAAAAQAAINDFAPAPTTNYPTPIIPTNVNPLGTEEPPATTTLLSGTQAATFFNPSATVSPGTTLRAASTPSASANGGNGSAQEEGEGGSSRASGMSLSAVALVAAIAGLVVVMPF